MTLNLELGDLNGAADGTGCASSDKWKLFDYRFRLAWSSFEFHAKQRTTVFNFFIVSSGIIANVYAALFADGKYQAAAVIALVAATISLCFVFLDHRNEELVHMAEDVLRELERSVLFKSFEGDVRWPYRRSFLFWWQKPDKKKQIQLGIHLREEKDAETLGKSPYRHGRWIPVIQVIVMTAFFCGFVAAIIRS